MKTPREHILELYPELTEEQFTIHLVELLMESYAKEHVTEFVRYLHPIPELNKQIIENEYTEWRDKTDDRPMCDECGNPLTNDEIKAGTCEDCLCPE